MVPVVKQFVASEHTVITHKYYIEKNVKIMRAFCSKCKPMKQIVTVSFTLDFLLEESDLSKTRCASNFTVEPLLV